MPVGGAVPDRLAEVLDASASMIVLCTPASVRSEWVGKEIREFTARHPTRKIIAVVGEGNPDSADCYPAELRALGEPLAADIRAPQGRRQAVVKIASAILGVDPDQLVGRIQKRSASRRRWIAVGGGVAAGVVVALGAFALVMSQQAERADNLARANVERLLTDTRKEMDEVGRMKAKAAVHDAAKAYFDGKVGKRLNSEDLLLKAEWLRQEGIDAYKRGEKELAMAQREDAFAATIELLKRDPDNPDFLFSHSQSAYWVGDYYLREGPTEDARKPWEDYRDTAMRLVAVAPDFPGAKLEVHYASVNLGILALYQERDPRAAASAFKDALDALDVNVAKLDDKLNLSRSHLQYVEALAQFAPASEVLAAVQRWEPVLEDLERSRDASDDLQFHLANAWDKVIGFREDGDAHADPAAATGRTLTPGVDPDNLTSVKLTVELSLAAGASPACNTLPSPPQTDPTDRTQLRLADRCLPQQTAGQQAAFCRAFASKLDSQLSPFELELELEAVWASLLGTCSKFADKTGQTGLSDALDAVAQKRFFNRSFEEMRYQTQRTLAGFDSRAGIRWITDLNTSLKNRGWHIKGEK
jgi:tetratricopeptide (TPR) repeat protein